jgi:hypothetical protein
MAVNQLSGAAHHEPGHDYGGLVVFTATRPTGVEWACVLWRTTGDGSALQRMLDPLLMRLWEK